MFHEYALDPAAISNWDRTRFFLDAFGPWKGRFLAQLPRKKWKKLVHQALRCPDIEKAKIVERLANLDDRIFSPRVLSGAYDPEQSWFDNALAQHAHLPFRAIITEGQTGTDVLDAASVDERSDLWRVETGCMVPRDAAVYADKLDVILRMSRRIIYVSPFFRADQPDKTSPLVAICSALAKVPEAGTLEVHFGEARSYALGMSDAERYLPIRLPRGSRVTLRCWSERGGGARLHNRYLLTDIGGVQFGDEIEAGEAGHTDRLSILDKASWLDLWEQYAGAAPAFNEAGAAREFSGARV